MDNRLTASDASLAALLERAVKWGLPVAPLFSSMLYMLATTPSTRPEEGSAALYLMCMAGACAGLLVCPLMVARGGKGPQRCCAVSACALELSWVILTIGGLASVGACIGVGIALAGASTAALLVLWLATDQEPDARVELVKYAAAFLFAFVLYELTRVFPLLGWLSFAFPLATGIPLYLRHARSAPQRHVVRVGSGRTARPALATVARTASSAVILVLFGAGIAVLGYDGPPTDYALAVAAALVLVPIALGDPAGDALVGQAAPALAVVGLCCDFLFGTGAPYAVFLAGCAGYVACLPLALRRRGNALVPASVAELSRCLGMCNLAAALGLGIASIAGTGAHPRRAVLLATLIVVADLVRRLCWGRLSRPMDASPTYADERNALLARIYGLTARETDVARYLCDNRSIGYMCAELGLAASTVKTHVRHVYEKMGIHSRSELQLRVDSDLAARQEEQEPQR